MSSINDALTALKNVVLMQERLSVMQKELEKVASDVTGLNRYCVDLDKRVVRIEALIEMSGRGGRQPRIEG